MKKETIYLDNQQRLCQSSHHIWTEYALPANKTVIVELGDNNAEREREIGRDEIRSDRIRSDQMELVYEKE